MLFRSVLSESRALNKELNQSSDQQHKLSNLNAQLSSQLGQLQSERTLLEERLRVATLESDELKQMQGQQQEASAALTLRALKAEAALENLKAQKDDTPEQTADAP